MHKFFTTITLLLIFCVKAISQYTDTATTKTATTTAQVYHVKNVVDIPIAVAGTGWTLYGFSKIYGRKEPAEAEIIALDRNNVNSFDRPVIDNYSTKAKDASDMFFYGSMPLPLVLLLDKKIRKDAPKVGLLYLESMAITGTLYTSAAMLANRFRPYAYNKKVPLSDRTYGGAKNSFFAGHPALVATSTFFMAKVYSDYHPDMSNKWILFTLAGGATATTGILRLKAGQHFYTDVITGVAVGTLSGILVPHIHKNKNSKLANVTLLPGVNMSGGGFTMLYHIR
jgi:membrane-associated phospholipid phosphatase